jgi:iron complex outermembrane receptor protein
MNKLPENKISRQIQIFFSLGIIGKGEFSMRIRLQSYLLVFGAMMFMASLSTAQEEAEKKGSEVSDYVEFDLEELLSIPVVESASKRKQSLMDAPASLTVITAEDIRASNATNIAELFRRVCGVHVLQTGANNYSIGLRGVTMLANNRVLVLIDGRQVAERLSGYQPWGALPVLPGDIERIEILRGPGSTLYGSDALSGVINIITKRALDNSGFEAEAWGSLSMLSEEDNAVADELWAYNGGGARLSFGWANDLDTFGVRLSLGLTNRHEWPSRLYDTSTLSLDDLNSNADPDAFSYPGPIHINGPMNYSVYASMDYKPSQDLSLMVNLSHIMSEHLLYADITFPPFSGLHSIQGLSILAEKKNFLTDFLSLKFEIDGQKFKTDVFGQMDPNSSMILSYIYESYFFHSILQLDMSLFDERNITTFGIEASYFHISEFFSTPNTFFTGLIVNNETRLLSDKSLIINLGGRLEQIIADDDNFGQVTYRHISPRVALVWKMNDNHSLRLSGSTSFRTPTTMEAFSDLGVQFSEPPIPPVRTMIGNPKLKPEQLYAIELGYRGTILESLWLDAVVFGQQVNGLIGNIQENIQPMTKDNLQDFNQIGIELEIQLNPTKKFSGYLNYAFIYSIDADTEEQAKDWPVHIYGIGGELRLPFKARFNLDAYLVFDYAPLTSWAATNIGLPLTLWQNTQAADTAWIDLRLGRYFFDGNVEIFLAVKNLVGFFRESSGLRMYPVNTFQPIGGTFMIGISLLAI